MTLKSTPSTYGRVPVAIHWSSALLIVLALVSGFGADGSGSLVVLRIHVSAGITVLVLTLIRVAWWMAADRKPQPIESLGPWQARMSAAVHGLFYVVILGMAASGVGMLVLSGAAPILLGETAMPLPDFSRFPPRLPHGLGARLLVALLVLHTGAALYHHFVKRDHLLHRMGLSR